LQGSQIRSQQEQFSSDKSWACLVAIAPTFGQSHADKCCTRIPDTFPSLADRRLLLFLDSIWANTCHKWSAVNRKPFGEKTSEQVFNCGDSLQVGFI